MGGYIRSISPKKHESEGFYWIKDIRLKLNSGVGSLDRFRYYLLIEGPSRSGKDEVILEMKEQTQSAVNGGEPGQMDPTAYGKHEGQRAALSTKAQLTQTDPLVGHTSLGDTPFLIREKSPDAADFDYTKLDDYDKFKDAVVFFVQIVAKNHALADTDYDPESEFKKEMPNK